MWIYYGPKEKIAISWCCVHREILYPTLGLLDRWMIWEVFSAWILDAFFIFVSYLCVWVSLEYKHYEDLLRRRCMVYAFFIVLLVLVLSYQSSYEELFGEVQKMVCGFGNISFFVGMIGWFDLPLIMRGLHVLIWCFYLI